MPLLNIGPVAADGTNLNVIQSYTVKLETKGDGRGPQWVTDSTTNSNVFYKPADNIGNKSIPDYAAYASSFVYEVRIPAATSGPDASSWGSARRASSSTWAKSSTS